jgi:hypothetical protein
VKGDERLFKPHLNLNASAGCRYGCEQRMSLLVNALKLAIEARERELNRLRRKDEALVQQQREMTIKPWCERCRG